MTLGILFRSLGFLRNEWEKIILNQFNHLAIESDLSVRNTIAPQYTQSTLHITFSKL